MTTTIEAPVAAPPTNAQRAAYICHQGGVRAFVPFFTQLLDEIDELKAKNAELDASNTRLHMRCAELELKETERQARRKDKPLVATT